MLTSFSSIAYEYGGKCWAVHLTSQRQMKETGTLETGREAANKGILRCVCYNSGKRKRAGKPKYIKVYIFLTTEIPFMLKYQQYINILWSSTRNENARIYLMFFIQRIPRCLINDQYGYFLCNVPNVLHTWTLIPVSKYSSTSLHIAK